MQLEPEQFYATELVSYDPGPGAEASDKTNAGDIVLVHQMAEGQFVLDVPSRGQGGSIVLGFGDSVIIDGPGPDFIDAEKIHSG